MRRNTSKGLLEIRNTPRADGRSPAEVGTVWTPNQVSGTDATLSIRYQMAPGC